MCRYDIKGEKKRDQSESTTYKLRTVKRTVLTSTEWVKVKGDIHRLPNWSRLALSITERKAKDEIGRAHV